MPGASNFHVGWVTFIAAWWPVLLLALLRLKVTFLGTYINWPNKLWKYFKNTKTTYLKIGMRIIFLFLFFVMPNCMNWRWFHNGCTCILIIVLWQIPFYYDTVLNDTKISCHKGTKKNKNKKGKNHTVQNQNMQNILAKKITRCLNSLLKCYRGKKQTFHCGTFFPLLVFPNSVKISSFLTKM